MAEFTDEEKARIEQCQTAVTEMQGSLSAMLAKLETLEKRPSVEPDQLAALQTEVGNLRKKLVTARQSLANSLKSSRSRKSVDDPKAPPTDPSPPPRKKTGLGLDWL